MERITEQQSKQYIPEQDKKPQCILQLLLLLKEMDGKM
jgi:hypothetical protein